MALSVSLAVVFMCEVKIMSLMQNMLERPLVRKLRKVQDRINELEYEMRELWPKDRQGVGDQRARYHAINEYNVLISKAHTKRFELIKRIGEGRRHDE